MVKLLDEMSPDTGETVPESILTRRDGQKKNKDKDSGNDRNINSKNVTIHTYTVDSSKTNLKHSEISLALVKRNKNTHVLN